MSVHQRSFEALIKDLLARSDIIAGTIGFEPVLSGIFVL